MTEWRLAWTVARREMRSGVRGFRVFLLCLILGVAVIAGVGSLSESVLAGLVAEGGRLLGGDVDLRLHNRPFSGPESAWLRSHAAEVSDVTEMRTMARPVDGRDKRTLIELKAVDHRYPLVGAVTTGAEAPLSNLLERRDGVWGAVADGNLLTRLGLDLGGRIEVGASVFELRAILDNEPDRVASVFSFGPRVMVADEALGETGLVQPGSQIHFHRRLLLEPGTDFARWRAELDARFPTAGWRVRGTDEAAPGVRRFIDRLTLFLTFVGLTVLLVGGIGIANAVGSYLDGKTATIATLKCLGAPGRLVFRAYMLQVMVMTAAGTLAGLAVGWALPALGVGLAGAHLPVAPVVGVFAKPLAQAALFGVLVSATFATWPVARACEVPASQLFRDRIAPAGIRPRLAYGGATAIGGVGLAVLVFATTSDSYLAAWFVGGALATFLALRLGGLVAMRLAARLRPRHALVRLAVANLSRPGAATVPVTLSLGLGLSVLIAVSLIEGNLGRQISDRLPEEAPAFFFIDIQSSQVPAFDAALAAVPGTRGYRRVPSMRGRIVRIKGVPVEEAKVSPDTQWAIRGDRALTYAAERPAGSDIVAGAWWPADYAGPPAISLDAGLARGFDMELGDTLTLNVLGREITAKVLSLREIDWRSLRFDFAIIFAPGVLENAPQTYIAAIEAPPEAEDAVERAATDGFANVSAIRVRDALAAAARILAGVGWAIRGTAALTIAAGLMVLAGAIAAGQRRRIYDAVVFKVLGASRRRILGIFLAEYGLIGLVTGTIAAAVGTLTAWAVVRYVMDSDWSFQPGEAALTLALALAATLIFGFAATWRALGRKAAPYLRNE